MSFNLINLVDEFKEKISNDEYLTVMNESMKIHAETSTMEEYKEGARDTYSRLMTRIKKLRTKVLELNDTNTNLHKANITLIDMHKDLTVKYNNDKEEKTKLNDDLLDLWINAPNKEIKDYINSKCNFEFNNTKKRKRSIGPELKVVKKSKLQTKK
jgi:predicted nuclease with TOPRIM domain